MKKKQVVLAMSGGVDSSVAAILLREQGFDVYGVMFKLWSAPYSNRDNQCCTIESMQNAQYIADILDIPFQVLNKESIFFDKIVKYFINDYVKGNTPNPCVRCNKLIKWSALIEYAKQLGADYIATGHYAQIKKNSNNYISLYKALDKHKDQSYFLFQLSQEELSATIFPLGSILKEDVKKIALQFNLPVANKPESQDLCFIGNNSYQEFLKNYAPESLKPGPIISAKGNKLGDHKGLAFYTIGQRKGIQISSSKPIYVIDKDANNNTLIVGENDYRFKNQMTVENVNWITPSPPHTTLQAKVRIRYNSSEEPAEIIPIDTNKAVVNFLKPVKDITPGQAAVFYQNDQCLGGGIIKRSANIHLK